MRAKLSISATMNFVNFQRLPRIYGFLPHVSFRVIQALVQVAEYLLLVWMEDIVAHSLGQDA
jgi:hypothetical protein